MTAINPRGRLRCHCCNHEHSAAIDDGLSRGVPTGVLAMLYGVSPDSLQQHRQNHQQKVTDQQ